jgi:hypothetical protein
MHIRLKPRNKTARNTWLFAGIQQSCFSYARVGGSIDRTAGWGACHLSLASDHAADQNFFVKLSHVIL